jgi:hypothetical protein
LEAVFRDCEADEACGAAFPNLLSEFTEVLTRSAQGKAYTAFKNPSYGVVEKMGISRNAFATTLCSALQSPHSAARAPLLIHQAAKGDFTLWAELVRNLRTNSPVGSGSFLAIIASGGFLSSRPFRCAGAPDRIRSTLAIRGQLDG